MPNNRPPAEFEITRELVRELVDHQAPQYAGLSINFASAGWDNEMYRLGEKLAVRLPRRQLGADLIANEQRWLPEISQRLPISVPCPLYNGKPTPSYPWNWSIVRWFDGDPLAYAPFVDREQVSVSLAKFLTGLHVDAPNSAPTNASRGVPLKQRDVKVRGYLKLADIANKVEIEELWNRVCDLPIWPNAPVWLHGDLHPLNLIIGDAKLKAVIDFGDLTSGDPATDYAVAWMIFDANQRSEFRNSLSRNRHVDDATWGRAKGAALAFALAVLANSADDLVLERIGKTTLKEVLRN